jgi:hypothetical protein
MQALVMVTVTVVVSIFLIGTVVCWLDKGVSRHDRDRD